MELLEKENTGIYMVRVSNNDEHALTTEFVVITLSDELKARIKKARELYLQAVLDNLNPMSIRINLKSDEIKVPDMYNFTGDGKRNGNPVTSDQQIEMQDFMEEADILEIERNKELMSLPDLDIDYANLEISENRIAFSAWVCETNITLDGYGIDYSDFGIKL